MGSFTPLKCLMPPQSSSRAGTAARGNRGRQIPGTPPILTSEAIESMNARMNKMEAEISCLKDGLADTGNEVSGLSGLVSAQAATIKTLRWQIALQEVPSTVGAAVEARHGHSPAMTEPTISPTDLSTVQASDTFFPISDMKGIDTVVTDPASSSTIGKQAVIIDLGSESESENDEAQVPQSPPRHGIPSAGSPIRTPVRLQNRKGSESSFTLRSLNGTCTRELAQNLLEREKVCENADEHGPIQNKKKRKVAETGSPNGPDEAEKPLLELSRGKRKRSSPKPRSATNTAMALKNVEAVHTPANARALQLDTKKGFATTERNDVSAKAEQKTAHSGEHDIYEESVILTPNRAAKEGADLLRKFGVRKER